MVGPGSDRVRALDRCLRPQTYRQETGLTGFGREFAVGVKGWATPLDLIAFRGKRFDALVKRNRPRDFVPNRDGAVEPDVVGTIGKRSRHRFAEHPPFGFGGANAAARNLRREDDATL